MRGESGHPHGSQDTQGAKTNRSSVATDNQDGPASQAGATWAKDFRPGLNAESKCQPECIVREDGHISQVIPSLTTEESC